MLINNNDTYQRETLSERPIWQPPREGGHWPRKEVWGCAALKTPFQASPAARKGPISSKRISSQDPILRKFWNFSLNSASPAWIFTQILAHKPPNLEIFSSQAPKFGNFQLTSPTFQRQMSVRKPHTSEIWAAHPYLKKVECPPPQPLNK